MIGPIVRWECKTHAGKIDACVEAGELIEFSDQKIPGFLFLQLLEKYNLGDGETECLAYCVQFSTLMACDDRRARNVAYWELGQDSIMGSLALLKQCVSEDGLTSKCAFQSYKLMKERGAFLPVINEDFFKG